MGSMELADQSQHGTKKKKKKKKPQDGSEVQKCLPDKPADRVQSLELMGRWKERSESAKSSSGLHARAMVHGPLHIECTHNTISP